MITSMTAQLGRRFPLTELDCGEFRTQKLKGMTFSIRAFHAEGLGHVSVMQASGFFGLMKMDTLIINPTERDMPLLSYDRVHAMGRDTLIYEVYDTQLSEGELSPLMRVKGALRHPEHDLGAHWYDTIKLPVSVAVKGKGADREAFDTLCTDYLREYLTLAENAPACDPPAKREKASVYVEGLLAHGGPSTDVFKGALGEERTGELFRTVLFGTRV